MSAPGNARARWQAGSGGTAGQLSSEENPSPALAFEQARTPYLALPEKVHQVRLAARTLSLWPVFVAAGEGVLVIELFDGHGRLAETWSWRFA